MFRFENCVFSFAAVLWIDWDDKHPDKRIAVHFLSAAEPLVFTGPQAARFHALIEEMFPDNLTKQRDAKLPKEFVIQRAPIVPPSVG